MVYWLISIFYLAGAIQYPWLFWMLIPISAYAYIRWGRSSKRAVWILGLLSRKTSKQISPVLEELGRAHEKLRRLMLSQVALQRGYGELIYVEENPILSLESAAGSNRNARAVVIERQESGWDWQQDSDSPIKASKVFREWGRPRVRISGPNRNSKDYIFDKNAEADRFAFEVNEIFAAYESNVRNTEKHLEENWLHIQDQEQQCLRLSQAVQSLAAELAEDISLVLHFESKLAKNRYGGVDAVWSPIRELAHFKPNATPLTDLRQQAEAKFDAEFSRM